MAKQLGVIQFRGKLGQTVGVKKSGTQKNNTMRVRVDSIRNPKTAAQVSQRMRLTPAVNFYRALKLVLNHSFQGVQYGGPSYNFFVKEALKSEVFPYVTKGELRPYPGVYLISKGSLPSVMGHDVSNGRNSFNIHPGTGSLTERILYSNPQLKEGDQLTFVQCYASDGPFADPEIIWDVRRWILGEDAPDWLEYADDSMECFVNSQYVAPSGWNFYGGAIIVSRPSVSLTSGTVTWERSTTYMSVSPEVLAQLISSAARTLAEDSYANQVAASSSDWYLNQGEDEGGNSESMLFVTVTKNIAAGGTVTGGGSYPSGTTVQLVATPASNYAFVGWYQGNERVSTNATYSFVVASSISFEARFQLEDMP